MVPQEEGNGYHEKKVSLVGVYVSVWAEEVVRSACGVDGDVKHWHPTCTSPRITGS